LTKKYTSYKLVERIIIRIIRVNWVMVYFNQVLFGENYEKVQNKQNKSNIPTNDRIFEELGLV